MTVGGVRLLAFAVLLALIVAAASGVLGGGL